MYMLHRKTRSRSWKGVAVLGALPHFVRCVCQVPTPFQRSETTTYLHNDLTLHSIHFALWFPNGKPCLLVAVPQRFLLLRYSHLFFMLSFCLLIDKSLLTPLIQSVSYVNKSLFFIISTSMTY